MSPDPKTHFYLETLGMEMNLLGCNLPGQPIFHPVVGGPICRKTLHRIFAHIEDHFFGSSGVYGEKLELYELNGNEIKIKA